MSVVLINRRKCQIFAPNFNYNNKKNYSFAYKACDDPLDPEQQAQGGGHWQQHFQQHFQGHGFNPFGNWAKFTYVRASYFLIFQATAKGSHSSSILVKCRGKKCLPLFFNGFCPLYGFMNECFVNEKCHSSLFAFFLNNFICFFVFTNIFCTPILCNDGSIKIGLSLIIIFICCTGYTPSLYPNDIIIHRQYIWRPFEDEYACKMRSNCSF